MGHKLLMSLVLVSVLGGVAGGGYLYYEGQQQPLRYLTAAVERGSITTTVNATGIVNAVTTVQVGSQVSGIIQKLLVDFNSPVKEGEIIAQLDPAPLATKVAQARANVASAMAAVQVAQATTVNAKAAVETAQANAENARANIEKSKVALADARRILDRNKEMTRRALIAKNDLDTAQATYDGTVAQLKASEAQLEAAVGQLKSASAQQRLAAAQEMAAAAQVDQTKAALQAAELDLEHTTIRAPVNGIVVSRSVDVGQTVAASLQAPILFLIAQDLTQMQVDTNVSEADIGRIRVGQKVTFAVDAYQNVSFTGAVTQVRNAPITVQNVVTYDAVVQVANPDLRLKPGMTANVSFLVAERQDILKVPTAALRFQPEGVAQETSSQDGKAPAPQRGGGGSSGGGRFQEMQQQLAKELSLTPEQQARLSEVFQKSGRQSRAMREEESEERRQAMRREMQTQIRAQIREMLTPEQRQKYEALLRTREESQPQTRPGRVWAVGANGTPEPHQLTIGIANDTHTEVVSGDLIAGQQIITGSLAAKSSKRPAQPPGFGAGPRL
jgi:HlyD family secretion protein